MQKRDSHQSAITRRTALIFIALSLVMTVAASGQEKGKRPAAQAAGVIVIEQLSFSTTESPAGEPLCFSEEMTVLETNEFLQMALSLYKGGKLSPGSSSTTEVRSGKAEILKAGSYLTLSGGTALPPTQRELVAQIDQVREGSESYYLVSIKVDNPVLSLTSGTPSIDFKPAAYITVRLKQGETIVFALPKAAPPKDAPANLQNLPTREYVAIRLKPYQGPPQIFS